MKWEYCSVAYIWIGRGFTQEIDSLYMNGQELPRWRGGFWNDFLSQMGQERWELTATVGLNRGDGDAFGLVAYQN